MASAPSARQRTAPRSTDSATLSLSPSPSPSPARAPKQPLTHTAPLASSSILITLLGFTVAMVILPLGSYFLAVDRLFAGNATAAGAVAALVANLVLVAYVYLAWKDDQVEQRARLAAAARERGELEGNVVGGDDKNK